MLKIFGAAVAAIAMATAANALSVSSTNGPDTLPVNVLFDFDSAASTPSITGNYDIVTGSSSGLYAAPLGDTTAYLTVPEDIQATPLSATVDFGGTFSKISFYWGSIDVYNTIQFFDADGVALGAVMNGSMIPFASADGNQTTPQNSRRVTFDFEGKRAASMTIGSTNYAFELDTISGSVPEPTTWAMLIAGMGLVGASMRRRRTLTSVAA